MTADRDAAAPQRPSGQSCTEYLFDVNRELSAILQLPRLLDRVIAVAPELTGCESAAILLIDGASGELRFEASTYTAGHGLASIPEPLEGSVAGWVVVHRQPIAVDDLETDARFSQQQRVAALTRIPTRSILAAPLLVKAQIIGCLEVINKTGGGVFSAEDSQALTLLAAQAAVAIENARLFEQSDRISELVHEVRSPLTAIVACVELLQRPGLRPEQVREFVRTIRSGATRLSNLATDFLDLTRLESGRIQLAREPVRLDAMVRETLLLQQLDARAHGIEILFEPLEGLPPVTGDRDRLKRVVLNLIGNAIKYSREGGRIWIRLAADAQAVRLIVRDEGCGIPADCLAHIFERFFRVPGSEGYSEGAGLGLTIARQIVESHGGTIAVDSEVGAGSTFTVSLPAAVE